MDKHIFLILIATIYSIIGYWWYAPIWYMEVCLIFYRLSAQLKTFLFRQWQYLLEPVSMDGIVFAIKINMFWWFLEHFSEGLDIRPLFG